MSYKNKYQKYKSKYINLKKKIYGGTENNSIPSTPPSTPPTPPISPPISPSITNDPPEAHPFLHFINTISNFFYIPPVNQQLVITPEITSNNLSETPPNTPPNTPQITPQNTPFNNT